MGAFDSIKMGHRCKSWLVHAGPPSGPKHMVSMGTSAVSGQQWIVNAAGDSRIKDVEILSQVVLDGGPRWVLSTALGFLTGGMWWTVVYATVFAVANYAMYVNTKDPSWTSGAELAGVVAYIMLAVAISVASVPGAWCVSEWKGLALGLVVEMVLCVSVVVSVAIAHDMFSGALRDNSGLSMYVDAGRWSIPALLWVTASQRREEAVRVVELRLSSFWCSHPMGEGRARLDQTAMNILWNDWSLAVEKCAKRVGGYSMLGFSAQDLDVLSASLPTSDARREIQHLRSSGRRKGATADPWLEQSLAFLEGYGNRLVVTGPERDGAILDLNGVVISITALMSAGSENGDVDSYKKEIESSPDHGKYMVTTQGNDHWFFAGALIADSDSRARGLPLAEGSYGCRLAVAISLIAKGTDPRARLACYPDVTAIGSGLEMLSSAISASVEALVSDLASSADVTINIKALGTRGLAYVEGAPKILSYSPDELVAASQAEEVFVITPKTFSTSSNATKVFEDFWAGSKDVRKQVDVRDMVPLAGFGSEAGISALLGWLCHVVFTLAMLMLYLYDGTSKAIVVLLLVSIPATDKRVSCHLDDHFFMMYVGYILNYTRLISRWASLAQRGQATLDRSNNLRKIVFLFVNILPVVACYLVSGWAWWVAFIPCVLANTQGLLNTFWFGWASAFEYEWWSWHVPNKWFAGLGFLGVKELRKRVGMNVLSVLEANTTMEVEHVTPNRGKVESTCRFVVVGGGRFPKF